MATPPEAPVPWFRRALRWLRIPLITLFVLWHLFFLLFRNPLDLWWDELVNHGLKKITWWETPFARMSAPETPAPDATPEEVEQAKNHQVDISAHWLFMKVDSVTYRYGHFLGVEQGWSMFSPPLARSAPFLIAELVFADDTTATLHSPNNPDVEQRAGLTSGYIRLGGWRQRKLEDYIVGESPDTIPDKTDPQIFQAYVRWSIRRWQQKFPDDSREVKQVNLIRRRIYFPEPNKDLTVFVTEVYPIGSFTPDGGFVKP